MRSRPTAALSQGQVFFDMTGAPGEDAIDGIKVDQRGNLYVSGPGGLWILSPAGNAPRDDRRAPSIRTTSPGETPTARRLYLCARSSLYRIKLGVAGVRP